MADGEVSLLARTTRGVEWVAAAEIEARLGARSVTVAHREVRFGLTGLPATLQQLGTVDDVFLVSGETSGIGHTRDQLPRIAAAAADLPIASAVQLLRGLRPIPEAPAFDVTATFLGRRNYNRFEIEDAVGTAIAAASGWRYESRAEGKPPPTDFTVRVHLVEGVATFALRIGAAPAHRRPYRKLSRTASLRPPVARCLALLAGLASGLTLYDPFCGAGTIPIEAAMAEPEMTAAGSDVDATIVDSARGNARAAGVDCAFEVADAGRLPLGDGEIDRFACNPPWGEAVEVSGSLEAAWREARRVLRDQARIAVLGPADLLAGAARGLGRDPGLRLPIRVLGKQVEIALFAEEAGFAAAGALYGAELDRALERFAA